MKNKIIILIILVIALIVVVFATNGRTVKAPTEEDTSSTQEITPLDVTDLISVSNIKSGDTISSPLTITGEARGTWYFEASFPISITNAEGTKISEGYATAQGDWMTNEFVPFIAKIEFKNSTTTSKKATLKLSKDNPSGLPQHDASIEIPVVIK